MTSVPLFRQHALSQVLIRFRANLDIASNDGSTPLFAAVQKEFDEIAKVYPRGLGKFCVPYTCLQVLIDNEADVNAASGGNMPLHIAVEKSNVEIALVAPMSL